MNLTIKKGSINITDKTKTCYMSLACFIIIINCIVPMKWMVATGMDTVVCFLMCMVFIVLSFNGYISVNKKNAIPIVMLILLGSIGIVSGITFGVMGYISIGFFHLTVPTLLLCIINSKNQVTNILVSISIGAIAAFLCFFILSILFSPLSNTQYKSFVWNPNAVAEFAAMGTCGAIYLLFKVRMRWKWLLCLTLGFALSFVLFSRSRTGFLVVIAMIIIVFIYGIVNSRKSMKRTQVILCIAIVVVSVYISFLSVTSISNLIGLYNNEPVTTWIENSFDVNLQLPNESITPDFKETIKSSANRGLKGINNNDSFTSGRTTIWKKFIKEISFTGHESGFLLLEDGGEYNAHNGYLQVAYNFGFVAGGTYLILTIYLCIKLLRNFVLALRAKIFTEEDCIVCIFMSGFLVYSMLAAAVAPFSYFFVMAVDLAVIPFIGNIQAIKNREEAL